MSGNEITRGYSIEILIEEHENITRMLQVLRTMCRQILEGGEVVTEDFREGISFIRHYADRHHHGKEEKFLFPEMTGHLGGPAQKLITHGMLVEHDLGRGHVLALETALTDYEKEPTADHKLDILAGAMAYVNLLTGHIDKENQVVFTFAQRQLPGEVLEEVDQACRAYEKEEKNKEVRESYLALLKRLEEAYPLTEKI